MLFRDSMLLSRRCAAVFLLAGSVCGFSSCADAGRAVSVGRQVRGTIPLRDIDHSVWDQLLRRYVDDDGYVNYRAWHASRADRQKLRDYLSGLSSADPKQGDRHAVKAFWINAYNALTIYGILREYPTSSIRNHTARLVGYNIWKDLQLYAGGQPWALEDIEHRILRKTGDPRIHFAIVCASAGCPRLRNEAWTPDKVDRQLDLNARDFFSRAQNFRYDPGSGTFFLSEILKWYADDFGGSQADVLRTISVWLPDQRSQKAARQGRGRIRYLTYDWSLNDQARRGSGTRRR